jgi:hypothetical protein
MRSSSSRLFLLSLSILMLTLACDSVRASDLSYARIVRISMVSGDVQVSRPGHSSWEPAAPNMPVMQGMTIGTNNGSAEVQFEDGSTAWISQDTLVQFTELALADGSRISKLTLGEGTLSLMTELHRGDTFSVSTSAETMTVVKNSFFRIDCFHDGASVSVSAGELQVASAGGTQTVKKGQTLAYESKLKTVSLKANPRPDDWDHWTAERARATQVETAQSSSYVTPGFSYGLADMSGYGNWNYFAGYGYGWQPSGMGSCWMPFSNGDWNFYPGFGWTWISGEPWGWVPYHYGNWDYLPYSGWTWFPSDMGFWDPAPVNWYSMGNQVGWWPMGSGFVGSPALQYQQMADGCSGYGYPGAYGLYGNTRQVRLSLRPNRGPMSRGGTPTPPRLMLMTSQLGHGREITLTAVDESSGPEGLLQSLEPAENGKPSRIAFSAMAAQSPRAVAPMMRNMTILQRSFASAGNAVAPAKISSILLSMPSRNALHAEGGVFVPAMPSHRPSPMIRRSGYSASMPASWPGSSAAGQGWSGGSGAAGVARGTSTSSAGASHGGGKPN